jgi:hypothetical protein
MVRRLPLVLAAAFALVGCASHQPVPMRDGAFPLGSVRAGDDVRATTRSGQALSFEVASVEGGSTLIGDAGERVAAGDLESLEVVRRDKHKTHVALAVLGGVVAAGLILGNADATAVCAEYNADVCGDRLLR